MSTLPLALGMGWGALAAVPLARRARRITTSGRAAAMSPGTRRVVLPSLRVRIPGPIGRVAEALVARRRAHAVDARIAQDLPVVIDLLKVAVSAGCTPYLAVSVAGRWAPPALSMRLDDVRRACDLGAGFNDALGAMGSATPSLQPLVDALQSSDRFGAPVGDALARLAAEERASLRRRAETRARTVPVRLLFPLVFLVLPAFGLLTVAPALLAGLGRS